MTIFCDFDGTLTKINVLDNMIQCYQRNRDDQKKSFSHLKGVNVLREKIKMLEGITITEIEDYLNQNDFLRDGWEKFKEYILENDIQLVLLSGNITPIINFYHKKINAIYFFATDIHLSNGKLVGMSDLGKTIENVKKFCDKRNINPANAIVIGDDEYDIPFFELFGKSVAFNAPKSVNERATISISGDLQDLTNLLKKM